MIIKNKEQIGTTQLRRKALDIIEDGIKRVLPTTIMEQAISYDSTKKILTVNQKSFKVNGRIFVVGGGKAAGLMAEVLEKIIGPKNIEDGRVNCTSTNHVTQKTKIHKASHPIPDKSGIRGVAKMLLLKKEYDINKDDIVICLISGGGSALMPYPAKGIELEDKQNVTGSLLRSGAKIQEINTVRKHLSRTKGGQLGCYFEPATVVSLILSDVIGNDLESIASGPTVSDQTTFSDAYQILEKYNLLSVAPKNVLEFIKKGVNAEIEETPTKLHHCNNFIIGDNHIALQAMQEKARELGFRPYIVTSQLTGKPTEAARLLAKDICDGKYKEYDLLLVGGETTPTLPDNSGKGGRNQHFAAVSMREMEKYHGEWVVASIGTDGIDFIKEAAGAIVDKQSLGSAQSQKINIGGHIERFDSYTLFKKIGNSLILIGNTGTNVCDVMVYILK